MATRPLLTRNFSEPLHGTNHVFNRIRAMPVIHNLAEIRLPGPIQNLLGRFRVCSSGVKNDTQIHTHMCYSEFNDILPAIAEMDADVITIETSRSDMELLEAFRGFHYPNDIGPGVYDIHSPRVPSVEEMLRLMRKALAVIPANRLWINPDCGLKTRGWPEVEAALSNMVAVARQLRSRVTV